MDLVLGPAFWVSLTALTFLEIILGVDNLLFVSIAVGRLKGVEQSRARRYGVWGAMVLRILMLSGIFWIIQLDENPLFRLPDSWAIILGGDADEHARAEFAAFTLKDLILLGGGLFLLVKGTMEIHNAVESAGEDAGPAANVAPAAFGWIVVQIAIIDIVFSLA